ncbi:hypothetical protein [Alteraurantiacibacter buctensis]|uniref:hypothetical protein n=1 Tax=Alteraurantiacibacter buctensis TaxID=1503981 RepID=UPI0019291F6D|nr:hypothetical protein [Alteraurantiacibacter buctensis]
MPDDLTRHSERLLNEGRAVLRDNQQGGRHRRVGGGRPIGEGSRKLRRGTMLKRAKLIAGSVLGIMVAAFVAGIVLDGIGFVGVMVTVMAMVAAAVIFGQWPKARVPDRATLTQTQDARQLVARTELWLEHQRAALPPPAVRLVEGIGTQLDALGQQLAHVDPAHPAAGETRKLVGEILPEMIDAYKRIPANLRAEQRGGSSPDAQLVDGLGKISREIDQVTRQLAEGSLDDLAIRTRYLDYRYGDAEGVALPSPSLDAPRLQQPSLAETK